RGGSRRWSRGGGGRVDGSDRGPMSDTTARVGDRLETRIHPTAIIDPAAELGEGVSVGPYSIIGPDVKVGDGSEIGPHVLIERDTELGQDCRVSQGAVLGTDPQDLTFQGEETVLAIGDRTTIREYATLNRGTS